MESLAFIHIALEYENSGESLCNSAQVGYQQRMANPPCKIYAFMNWLQNKFFSPSPKRANRRVVNH